MHLSSGVEGMEMEGDRIASIVTREGTFPTDLVVSGAQLPDLRRLLPPSTSALASQLSRIQFLGNVCLVLVLPQQLSQFYWTNVMDPGAPFVGIIEQTNWVDPADLNRKRLVYISAYCPATDKRFGMTAGELPRVLPAVDSEAVPELSSEDVERAFVWKADYAQAVVTTGYSALVPEIRTPLTNLLLCTMAQIFPQDRQVSNSVSRQADRTDRGGLPPEEGHVISLVIPVFNEEENLPLLWQRIEESAANTWGGEDFEVLFVDDGSRDRSVEILTSLAAVNPQIRIVKLSRKFGHQSALSAGLHHARGDAVVLMDADLQDPPELVAEFLDKWRQGWQVMYAVRKARKEVFWKRWSYLLFYRILRGLSSVEIPADSGDFCLMDRRVVQVIKDGCRSRPAS